MPNESEVQILHQLPTLAEPRFSRSQAQPGNQLWDIGDRTGIETANI